jgi:hypothetical protein
LWAGTDDGLLQVSTDGGDNWTAIPVGDLPGVPDTAFVNDIKADLYDADTAYVCLDNHKYGDFKPYLLKTTDGGRSWRSIAGDLPGRHLLWRLVQDHVKRDLLFAATEFGVFFTIDGGAKWIKLSGGVPTISFRDLAIQRRENDLVGASFGRGFYVLDDYSPLREVSEETLQQEAVLFPIRKTPWYIQRRPLGQDGQASQGASYFVADNPPFGAVFTYHLANGQSSLEESRREAERELEKEWKDTPYVGFDELERERRQPKPIMILTIRDASGEVVRTLTAPAKKGFHRVAWDLTYPTSAAIETVSTGRREGGPRTGDPDSGFMAPPGTYSVTLSKKVDGTITNVAGPLDFEVVRFFKGVLEGTPPVETAVFMQEVAALQRAVTAASQAAAIGFKTIEHLEKALARSTIDPGTLDSELEALKQELYGIDEALSGNRSMRSMGEPRVPTVSGRLRIASRTNGQTDYGPTATHQRAYEIASEEFATIEPRLRQLLEVALPALEAKMEEAGVPWTPGRPLPEVR